MARESLTVNGTLDLMAGTHWDVETLVVWSPEPVGEDPVVAGRTGSLWRPKVHGQAGFRADMWVGDPSASRAVAWGYWEQIQAVVAQPSALLTVVWTLSEGATRTCQAELTGDVAPRSLGTTGWKASLEFSIPSGVWT